MGLISGLRSSNCIWKLVSQPVSAVPIDFAFISSSSPYACTEAPETWVPDLKSNYDILYNIQPCTMWQECCSEHQTPFCFLGGSGVLGRRGLGKVLSRQTAGALPFSTSNFYSVSTFQVDSLCTTHFCRPSASLVSTSNFYSVGHLEVDLAQPTPHTGCL